MTLPPSDPTKLESALAQLTARFSSPKVVSEITRRSGESHERTKILLDTYLNEASVGLRLIAPSLRTGQRVLEVGSGVGVLSGFLASRDFEVVGLEPGATGFSFMPTAAAVLAEHAATERKYQSLALDVIKLDPVEHGRFDLIFSVHVLEHVADPAAAFRAMSGVLADGGEMVHLCPNYALPYEPHLGIPLVPGFPRLSAFLFRRCVSRQPELWESLNFITARKIRRFARENGLVVTFDRGMLAASLRRLESDQMFAGRHPVWVRAIQGVIRSLGLTPLIETIPPGAATPMVARLHKPS